MALPISFTGKKVLITGGGRGLGKATIEKLYKEGAILFTVDKDEKLIENLKKEFPLITAVVLDLTDFEKTKVVIESFGPLDHLVNNAAINIVQNFMDVTVESMNQILDVNFKAVLIVSQAVARGMIESKNGGSIVNIASSAVNGCFPGLDVYSCAKAGVVMLTKMMAVELGPHNIRVNGIHPGVMDTPFILEEGSQVITVAATAGVENAIIKRLIQPTEVADMILFLLSSLGSMITGEIVTLDGGLSIYKPVMCN